MRTVFCLLLLLAYHAVFASPQMMTCSLSCNNRELVEISDTTWTEVSEIFDKPINSEKEERRRIAKALRHIELDLIEQFVEKLGQEDDYERISEKFSNRDETFNTRKALILLQKYGFIKHHIIRNSQKRTVWIGNKESAMALQAIINGEIYIVDPTSTGYGQEPLIKSYKHWKNEKSIKRLPEEILQFLDEPETPGTEQDVFE